MTEKGVTLIGFSPSIGMQRLSLDDLLSGPSQFIVTSQACVCVRACAWSCVCLSAKCDVDTHASVWTYVCECACAPQFQMCHKQLSLRWALCSPEKHRRELVPVAASGEGGCQLGPARSRVWDAVLELAVWHMSHQPN